MKKIPLHKKLLLGAAIAGSGYGSYKLFKHTDKGAERMRIPIINPVTPLLLMAADDRNTEIKKASLAAIPGAVIGGASASTLFKKHYNKMANTAADEVAKNVVGMKKNLSNTPWYKLGQKRAIKSEIDDTLRAGRETVAKHLQEGRKAGLKGAAIGGIVGGVMGAGLYAGRHDIKNKINNLYNKTISKENRPNQVKSSDNRDLYIPYGAVGGTVAGATMGLKYGKPLYGAAVGTVGGIITGGLAAGRNYIAEKRGLNSSPVSDMAAMGLTTAGGAMAIRDAFKYGGHISNGQLARTYLSHGAIGALAGAAAGAGIARHNAEKNNIKSSEAQESLRRVNEIIAGLTVKQATPIFKKIVAKKKAAGASTSQAQKAALKILHRIDK